MLHGPDGQIINSMSWLQFCKYQRWEEFPDRADNPPMTADFTFWIDGNKYYCTGEDFGFVFVDQDWKRVAYNKNFLLLLETPIWNGRSFRDCIEEILFEE